MKPRTTTDQPIAPDTVARWRAAAVAIAPLVLLAGFVYHPFLPFLTNPHAAAEAGMADTVRWGIAHLLVGVGSGFMILAFLGIRSLLREEQARIDGVSARCHSSWWGVCCTPSCPEWSLP